MSDTHPNTYAMDTNAKAKIEQHYEIIRLNNRIAALEAQNKKLVEALENSTQCLEAWKLYHPKFFDKADESAVSIARALLSEVTQ